MDDRKQCADNLRDYLNSIYIYEREKRKTLFKIRSNNMKNILTKFIDEPSENLLRQNELKIYNHLSNEERNNNSNDKILSLLKNELIYSLNNEEDKLIKRAIYKILIKYSTFFTFNKIKIQLRNFRPIIRRNFIFLFTESFTKLVIYI